MIVCRSSIATKSRTRPTRGNQMYRPVRAMNWLEEIVPLMMPRTIGSNSRPAWVGV